MGNEVEKVKNTTINKSVEKKLIYESIAMFHADGNYLDKEKVGIINIEEEKIREIEELLNESIKLQEKINKTLEI